MTGRSAFIKYNQRKRVREACGKYTKKSNKIYYQEINNINNYGKYEKDKI
jgi:hypothetical protein